jgi:cytidyltransferase-like protein
MRIGCVHGRFQPFHLGHFEYLCAAEQRSDHLIIGITQYEPDLKDRESPRHRLNSSDNPFSYWERVEIISAALRSARLNLDKFSIVPFPIHMPELIDNFVDSRSIMFTTIYDRWNEEKVRRLEERGFNVCVLWKREIKIYEGKSVRVAMREDRQQFERLVPVGVAEAVYSILDRRRSRGK